MPSALEIIAADAVFITFPVSDGDASRRPDNLKEPSPSAREVNWHRTMKMDEKYFCRWRNLIGQGIAKLMNKPDQEKHCIGCFPDGYWMFDHHKGPISNIRHDLYLFGSKTVLRFRSPAEFIPHGLWLLTDPTLNTRNCGCKYCGGSGTKSQTQISESLGLPTNRGPTAVVGGTTRRMRISVPKPPRRPNNSHRTGALPPLPSDNPWIPPAVRLPIPINPIWQTTSLNLEIAASPWRISDLTSSRRFRVGELVWGKPYLGHIPYWPAIVTNFALNTISERSTSHGDKFTVSQTRSYSLLFLGLNVDNINIDLEEVAIFPWHGLHEYMERIIPDLDIESDVKEKFDVAILAANNLLNSWAIFDRFSINMPEPAPIDHSFMDKRGSSSPSDHSTSFLVQSALDRSTPPENTALLEDTIPQRSCTRMVPPSPVKRLKHPSPMLDIHEPAPSTSDPTLNSTERVARVKRPVNQIRYEGIWYGAERIWLGDHVRLLPEREAFTESLRCTASTSSDPFWRQPRNITPSSGAATRGVLMRIDRIFVKNKKSSPKQLVVAGPLYEVADHSPVDEFTDTTDHPSDSSPIDRILYPWELTSTPPLDNSRNERAHTTHIEPFLLPPAPSGYVFRPLLPPGTELPLPLSFIAGRYYHDILQWEQPPQIPNPSALLTSTFNAAVQANAGMQSSLCCLLPGRYNHATCTHIKLPNRASMIQEAVDIALGTFERKSGRPNKSSTTDDDEMDVDSLLSL
ncbi:hypothetical protein BU17DRAFT_97032 [Hysterangium stoloniferum]|nr:hypothetical protein BU17DRAFT_97032 [Hysterangium stoloniferum]